MKPTILFIQGSFQTPLVYQSLIKGLKAQGFPVVSPALPSCTDHNAPDFADRSLIDDALSVRSELTRLVEYEHKKVVVVMHSYGGLVGSEAVTEDLSYSRRQSQCLLGGVIHLFYYCAFILPKGESVLSAFGESPNNDVRVGVSLLSSFMTEINPMGSCCSQMVASPFEMQPKRSTAIFPMTRQHYGNPASFCSPTKCRRPR